jgi:hypothetical protein
MLPLRRWFSMRAIVAKARRRITGAGPSLSVVDIKSTHPHGPYRTPPYLHAQCAHLAPAPFSSMSSKSGPRLRTNWPAVVALEPRRFPDCPVSFAHPLDAGARCLFVAPTDIAVDHLRQLVTEIGGQFVAIGEIVQRAIARGQRHVEASEAGTLTTQHARKIGSALARVESFMAFVSDNLFELESLDDCWRKGPLSSKHVVEEGTVDPRPPRPGRLTARFVYVFA